MRTAVVNRAFAKFLLENRVSKDLLLIPDESFCPTLIGVAVSEDGNKVSQDIGSPVDALTHVDDGHDLPIFPPVSTSYTAIFGGCTADQSGAIHCASARMLLHLAQC